MTTSGWIFLMLSLAFVYGLTFWCYVRILKAPAAQGSDDE